MVEDCRTGSTHWPIRSVALMFIFDDLIKLDDRGMQELMKEISKEDLPVALRGGSPEIKDKFLKNMSSRAAEMLKEDMEVEGTGQGVGCGESATKHSQSLPQA